MYSLSHIQTAFETPVLALRELNSIYHSRLGVKEGNPNGVNFFNKDWDNLVILDACRHDSFQNCVSGINIDGQLNHKTTLGTNTAEFLRANLHNRDFSDTIYLTASSMLYRESVVNSTIVPNFHDIIDIWRAESTDGTDSIPPGLLTDRAIETHKSNPSKRLVIHYIQPHTPFIGTFGQSHFESGKHAIWNEKLSGECVIPDETIWTAYHENLQIVLGEVSKLIDSLPGKTIITSDHGQAIGDRAFPLPYREYGHPAGIYIKPLTKVPWFVSRTGDRRNVSKGDSQPGYPRQSQKKNKDMIDQLKALGYR